MCSHFLYVKILGIRLMFFLEFLIVIILGLVLGSFATAMIYRIPRGIPWAFAGNNNSDEMTAYRSSCTSCKERLKPIDLIPLFSWLLTKGKCRYCHEPISIKYPLTEIAVVLACLSIYFIFGFSLKGCLLISLVPFLVALFVVDLEHMILPNELVFVIGFIALINMALEWIRTDDIFIILEGISSAAIYGLLIWFLGCFMSRVLKRQALGFGDVKFFIVAGLWLGLENLSFFFLLSGLFGIVFAIVWKWLKEESLFPFGPALIAALYVLLLMDGSLLL